MDVELRKWTLETKKELINICNKTERKYLSNRMPFPYQEEDADWWLNMVREQDGKSGIFRAVVVDGQYVGNISIEQKSDVHARDGEIGYYLLPEWYSRGIMTKAAKQVCKLAFSQLKLLRITGLVYEPNTASAKVLEKTGFVLEGIMKQAVWKDERVFNLCIYGKIPEINSFE